MRDANLYCAETLLLPPLTWGFVIVSGAPAVLVDHSAEALSAE